MSGEDGKHDLKNLLKTAEIEIMRLREQNAEQASQISQLMTAQEIQGVEVVELVDKVWELSEAQLSTQDQSVEAQMIADVLAQELFRIEPGLGAFAIDGDAFVIARLTGITPAEQASDPALKDNLADAVTGGMVNDLIEQLGAALENSIEIEIHPAVIDQVYQ